MGKAKYKIRIISFYIKYMNLIYELIPIPLKIVL